MPHQCLSCGHLFAEGSSQILQGCPECKGTRFFYTQSPVGEEERRQLADKAQRDLRQVVADMLQEAAPATAAQLGKADDGQWAQLKATDLRRLVKQVQQEQAKTLAARSPAAPAAAPLKEGPGDAAWENPDVHPMRVNVRVESMREEMDKKRAQEAKPDTVHIRKPGEYEIDVKGLLEKNPIVVHKDGAYLIHLPSLFDQSKK
jgi:predicted  nucleic acid-binding Zn-ribbon protein